MYFCSTLIFKKIIRTQSVNNTTYHLPSLQYYTSVLANHERPDIHWVGITRNQHSFEWLCRVWRRQWSRVQKNSSKILPGKAVLNYNLTTNQNASFHLIPVNPCPRWRLKMIQRMLWIWAIEHFATPHPFPINPYSNNLIRHSEYT